MRSPHSYLLGFSFITHLPFLPLTVLLFYLTHLIYLLYYHSSPPFLKGIFFLMFLAIFSCHYVSRPLVSKPFQSCVHLSNMFWNIHLCDLYKINYIHELICVLYMHVYYMYIITISINYIIYMK